MSVRRQVRARTMWHIDTESIIALLRREYHIPEDARVTQGEKGLTFTDVHENVDETIL